MPYSVAVEAGTRSAGHPYLVAVVEQPQRVVAVRELVVEHVGALKRYQHVMLPEMSFKNLALAFAEVQLRHPYHYAIQKLLACRALARLKAVKQEVIDSRPALRDIRRLEIRRGFPKFVFGWLPENHLSQNLRHLVGILLVQSQIVSLVQVRHGVVQRRGSVFRRVVGSHVRRVERHCRPGAVEQSLVFRMRGDIGPRAFKAVSQKGFQTGMTRLQAVVETFERGCGIFRDILRDIERSGPVPPADGLPVGRVAAVAPVPAPRFETPVRGGHAPGMGF